VLKADYTFKAHRLNDVPLCLYFMTHAYFMVGRAPACAALARPRR
jgi:cycloeucalenol cycloisomerase